MMGKTLMLLMKKDFRMMRHGKFFLMWLGFLGLYTLYVNFGYIRLMETDSYNVYLYDPMGNYQKRADPAGGLTGAKQSHGLQSHDPQSHGPQGSLSLVSSGEALEEALKQDANGVGIDAGDGTARVVLYGIGGEVDRHRADYALYLLERDTRADFFRNILWRLPESGEGILAGVTGSVLGETLGEALGEKETCAVQAVGRYTPEEKQRREITCELLFFEITAVGFLGIAAVLFKEKSMGVIRLQGVLPVKKGLFLLSKAAVFLVCDLGFALLLTGLNLSRVPFAGAASVLPGVLAQTALLSLIMSLFGLICAMVLRDFRQFTLAYLLITVFAASPVFMAANMAIRPGWIVFHPFYHIYMGLKNAYFQTPGEGAGYYGALACGIGALALGAWLAFRREMRKG